jgi:hypothetical protein
MTQDTAQGSVLGHGRRYEGIMRSYLKIVALIVGLVGAYLALLPLTV